MTHAQIRTVDGIRERQCRKCGEWWPDTTEFFYFYDTGHTSLRSPCKACIEEKRYETNQVKPCCVPGCTNPRYPCKSGLYRNSRCWEHRYHKVVAKPRKAARKAEAAKG